MSKPNKAETDQLELMWNQLCHEQHNGKDSALHPPPALMEAAQEIAAAQINGQGIDPEDVPESWFHLMVMYGESMFNYGQHCMKNGLLRANMEPCKCIESEVTDEGIKAFLEGATFGKDAEPNA